MSREEPLSCEFQARALLNIPDLLCYRVILLFQDFNSFMKIFLPDKSSIINILTARKPIHNSFILQIFQELFHNNFYWKIKEKCCKWMKKALREIRLMKCQFSMNPEPNPESSLSNTVPFFISLPFFFLMFIFLILAWSILIRVDKFLRELPGVFIFYVSFSFSFYTSISLFLLCFLLG